MKGYKQLTDMQRDQIGALKKAGMLQKDMAVIIGVSVLVANSATTCQTRKQAQ